MSNDPMNLKIDSGEEFFKHLDFAFNDVILLRSLRDQILTRNEALNNELFATFI